MTVDSTTAVNPGGIYAGQMPTTPPKKNLDSESFMLLLVAQLRNQDPSSPMDTNEMMSQQTALASLEQITNMGEVSREQFALTMRMAALNLVGQDVSYTNADGDVITGVATGTSFAHEIPTITVGDVAINLDRILASGTTVDEPTTSDDTAGSDESTTS